MENGDLLKLDNQLCFTIYACSREITRMYRPLLDELGITYPQYLVLLVLWEKHTCTVTQLGDELYLDSGTLTPLLKRMEEAGLVVRARSHIDERKVIISLTEAGKALRTKAAELPRTLLKFSGIDEHEFTALLQEFRQLLKRIHRLNEQHGLKA